MKIMKNKHQKWPFMSLPMSHFSEMQSAMSNHRRHRQIVNSFCNFNFTHGAAKRGPKNCTFKLHVLLILTLLICARFFPSLNRIIHSLRLCQHRVRNVIYYFDCFDISKNNEKYRLTHVCHCFQIKTKI